MSSDTWLETDAQAVSARPKAAAAILDSIARTLRQAPDDRRYSVFLDIREERDSE